MEQWILLANTTWVGSGGGDCKVQWNVAAEALTEGCGAYAYCLSVSGNIDGSETSCPEGIYEGEESFSIDYGINVEGEAASYFFLGSGNPVGTGFAAEGASNFLTDPTCVWF